LSKIAVFPGSFDPITKGHVNIVLRALPLFDKIVVAIGNNSSKKYSFTFDERIQWIREVFKNEPKVESSEFQGLTVNRLAQNT
jgi:pantetheine-phosphate adenylyltransferase